MTAEGRGTALLLEEKFDNSEVSVLGWDEMPRVGEGTFLLQQGTIDKPEGPSRISEGTFLPT